MPRILFIDVDGTLVDYHNRLPESAVTAIRAARAAGHRVYLCTGRSRAEMPEMLWQIGVDGMVGGLRDLAALPSGAHLPGRQCLRVDSGDADGWPAPPGCRRSARSPGARRPDR
mgnify:CR=1 FL=1